MRFYETKDPFIDKQPKMTFAKELSLPLHDRRPPKFGKRGAREEETDLSEINFIIEYSDPLLDTCYKDFEDFSRVMGIRISKSGVPFTVVKGESEACEAYSIKVTGEGVLIRAADTEGIRRAIYYVEDEMKRRDGAFLPLGEIKRKPFIKTRISRCYFSPASHAAVEDKENELLDDEDYYPDEYLNRLAHDGINALWLGASIRYLVKSDLVPEYGKDADRRMKKLNAVIEKCKRYGISTYLFSVDPASDYCNDDLHAHPDMMGEEGDIFIKHICPSVDKAVSYIKDAYKKVFTEAPGLKGYINLSVGESESHCASENVLLCKRCKKKFGTLGKTLAFVEKTIADAIHEVAPDAEYISWTYAHRAWRDEDIRESAENRHTSVRHLVNFEDLGVEKQLGRDRLAYDYWISYVGPGELFKKSIGYDKKRGVKTYAKIQVCSSHEISTVPYIIAPGLLYEKYKYMHDEGVEGVMQCWFFGNYPCLMNKAAGELSFEPFFERREDFLGHLAGIYFGEESDGAVRAYEKFAEGYRNFPIGVDFEWYSPMQDSPCAPYHLEPVDLPMPSTWLVTDMVGSDRVCDSILDGHTMSEVIELCTLMCDQWEEGSEILKGVGSENEQTTVAEATGLIFRSGLNTFKFYDLRNKLALGEKAKAEQLNILSQMEEIVKEEIEISASLIPITEKDNRIGYHSEAHGYKIFPEKLKWRIEEMKKLLETEFEAVRRRINAGEKPLPFYYGEENDARSYHITESSLQNAEWMPFFDENGTPTESAKIRVAYSEKGYSIELSVEKNSAETTVRIDPEFKMFHRTSPLFLQDGKLEIKESASYSLFGEHLNFKRSLFATEYEQKNNAEHYTLTFPCEGLEMEKEHPFRLTVSIFRDGKRQEVLAPDDRVFERLVLGKFSPDAAVFFVPK